MVFKGMTWTGVIVCFVLYCLVFVAVRFEMNVETLIHSEPRLGLLIFVVPGAIAALTSKEAPLTVALAGAFLATPVVLIALHFSLAARGSLLQEFAFTTSAAFWCGSGALVVMLSRTLLGHEEQS
ncbi:inner membrane protein YbjM [Erwinia pyri]|uniref:Inner membrane protein YbjM n=1 Tax=Erwinia pyri TaxID=3062598 RepID=A0AA50DKE4_9GAMM|nr:inner membrane protein YbjM [Erwinia sp. DE2]WLS77640.1 inner membrane protein YbjM [Erwinia sp. DE2]